MSSKIGCVNNVKCLALLVACLSVASVNAQNIEHPYPKVGNIMLDYKFKNVVNYPKASFSISDFKGQWLVIDFWSRWCSGCIASFPKIEKLNQQFRNKAKIITIGATSNFGGISDEKLTMNIFTSRAKRYNLTFPVAFDSLAAKIYDVSGVPAIFVINPQGVIVAKTAEIDSLLLNNWIEGNPNKYIQSYSEHEPRFNGKKYDYHLPLLSTGQMSNGGYDTAFISRSILTKWNTDMPENILNGWTETLEMTGNSNSCQAEVLGADLRTLFRIAYTGVDGWNDTDSLYAKLSMKLVLENRDSGIFQSNRKERTNGNSYAYSLILPKKVATPQLMRATLLEDLQKNFKLSSQIEMRKVEVYKLVVSDQKKMAKLKTNGGETQYLTYPDRRGFSLVNYPFSNFISHSHIVEGLDARYNFNYETVPPLIDETNIKFNIDMNFNLDPTDINQTLEVLHKYGLDIIKSEIDMRCIVIKDAK
jgi:thiol-disulfide isomerase/thioredoxin